MRSFLILGATSSIARACAEAFAARGDSLCLAGRDTSELQRLAKDLYIRFKVQVDHAFFDVSQLETHADFLKTVLGKTKGIDGVLLAIGSLAERLTSTEIIMTNFVGPVSMLELCAEYFVSQKKGCIVGLSSVAGDRGRGSNYIYGASKSALSTYLQGLRSRLYPHHVHVLTVKLGLIDTKMTFASSYPIFLAADPQKTGLKIIRALDQKKESVYIPRGWRIVMFVIRLIPEKLFKRIRA